MNFRFLELPGEVRNMVYRNLPGHVYLGQSSKPSSKHAHLIGFVKMAPSLAATCKKLRSEILYLAIEDNRIVFTTPSSQFTTRLSDKGGIRILEFGEENNIPEDSRFYIYYGRLQASYVHRFLASLARTPAAKTHLLAREIHVECELDDWPLPLDFINVVPEVKQWCFLIRSRLNAPHDMEEITEQWNTPHDPRVPSLEWRQLAAENKEIVGLSSDTDEYDLWASSVAKDFLSYRGWVVKEPKWGEGITWPEPSVCSWMWWNTDEKVIRWVVRIERNAQQQL
ncbi:MAG: hypothetical protein M1822_007440 [Bathelium mastoideum]|nr:MAG: hypothetical protein M1822_007440 [Bathelium mastoideum]